MISNFKFVHTFKFYILTFDIEHLMFKTVPSSLYDIVKYVTTKGVYRITLTGHRKDDFPTL